MAQIYEIFGKRLRVEHDESGYCIGCALFGLGVCCRVDSVDSANCCLDGNGDDNRRFVEVDSDGNDVEK